VTTPLPSKNSMVDTIVMPCSLPRSELTHAGGLSRHMLLSAVRHAPHDIRQIEGSSSSLPCDAHDSTGHSSWNHCFTQPLNGTVHAITFLCSPLDFVYSMAWHCLLGPWAGAPRLRRSPMTHTSWRRPKRPTSHCCGIDEEAPYWGTPWSTSTPNLPPSCGDGDAGLCLWPGSCPSASSTDLSSPSHWCGGQPSLGLH
jgi:hypothetical protein